MTVWCAAVVSRSRQPAYFLLGFTQIKPVRNFFLIFVEMRNRNQEEVGASGSGPDSAPEASAPARPVGCRIASRPRTFPERSRVAVAIGSVSVRVGRQRAERPRAYPLLLPTAPELGMTVAPLTLMRPSPSRSLTSLSPSTLWVGSLGLGRALLLGRMGGGAVEQGEFRWLPPPTCNGVLLPDLGVVSNRILMIWRAVHASAYDKNVEDQVRPAFVPDDVIRGAGNSDKYWGPHPKTGVFGPAAVDAARLAAAGVPEAGLNAGGSVLDQKVWYRPLEDVEKPAPVA